jgi:DNA recombination protein RmuC
LNTRSSKSSQDWQLESKQEFLMSSALIVIVVVMLFILLLAVLALLFRKPPQEITDLAAKAAVITDKIERVESIPSEVNALKVELSKLSERVAGVQQNQNNVTQNIGGLSTTLARTDSATTSLVQTTESLRGDLNAAQGTLAELRTLSHAQQGLEKQATESIQRLERVLAGSQSKGSAGENIVGMMLSKLPPEWQVRNFSVGNKVVEFGIRLPNGLVLPIDSKWAASSLLEEFVICEDMKKRQKITSQIQSVVLDRAAEIKKYIDPNLTSNFGIAAVPDSVFELCSEILPDLIQLNVVLISYSMFQPYLLLVFQTTLKTLKTLDLKKLDAYLLSTEGSMETLQEELEGRFSRALVMLDNSRAEMSACLSKLRAGLAGLQGGARDLSGSAITSSEA